MARKRAPRAGMCVVIALLGAACSNAVSGSGSPEQSGTAGETVGELHQSLAEPDYDDDSVFEYAQTRDDPVLLISEDEYDAWRDELPGEMGADAEALTLDDQVAVVGSYGKCMEVGSVQHLGEGELAFDVAIPPEDENTVCESMPLHVEVWVIDLAELEIDDPEDVELVG